MLHFEDMDLVGDGIGGIIGADRGTELGDDLAAVADGADIVDGDARLGVASRLDGLMDMVAPHPLPTMLG